MLSGNYNVKKFSWKINRIQTVGSRWKESSRVLCTVKICSSIIFGSYNNRAFKLSHMNDFAQLVFDLSSLYVPQYISHIVYWNTKQRWGRQKFSNFNYYDFQAFVFMKKMKIHYIKSRNFFNPHMYFECMK